MYNELDSEKNSLNPLKQLFPREFFQKSLDILSSSGFSQRIHGVSYGANGSSRLGSRQLSTATIDSVADTNIPLGSNMSLLTSRSSNSDSVSIDDRAFVIFADYMVQTLTVLCPLLAHHKGTLSPSSTLLSSCPLDFSDVTSNNSGGPSPVHQSRFNENHCKFGDNISIASEDYGPSVSFKSSSGTLPSQRPSHPGLRGLRTNMTWNTSHHDVKRRIDLHFPEKLKPDKDKLNNFTQVAIRKKKKNLLIRPEKLQQMFEKTFGIDTDLQMCIFLILILQHVTDELLMFSHAFHERLGNSSPLCIQGEIAQTLVEFHQFRVNTSPMPTSLDNFVSKHIQQQDYMKTAKVMSEYLNECFLRHMDMLLRCFRQPLRQSFADSADVGKIFGNLSTLYQEMRILYMELSDAMEASSDTMVATSFYVAVEESFFSEFDAYASTVLDGACALRVAALSKNTFLQRELSTFSVTFREGLRRKDKPMDDPQIASLLTSADCREIQQGNPQQSLVVFNYLYLAYKYLLPCLLQLPIYHFLHMAEAIEKLYELCPDEREKMVLNDVLSAINPIRYSVLQRVLDSPYSCYNSQSSVTATSQSTSKGSDVSATTLQNVSNYDDTTSLSSMSTISSYVFPSSNNDAPPPRNPLFYHTPTSDVIYNKSGKQHLDNLMDKYEFHNKFRPGQKIQFLREGPIKVRNARRHFADRYAFLYADFLLLCKRTDRRLISTLPIKPLHDLSYKAMIPLTAFHIADVVSLTEQNESFQSVVHMESSACSGGIGGGSASNASMTNIEKTNELYSFELHYYPEPPTSNSQSMSLTLATISAREKCQWLISFLTLQSYKVLNRYVIENPPDEIPLRLPLVKDYIYSLPDKVQYVEFEIKQPGMSNEVLIVKYGCMSKIIEYITHHVHFDTDSLRAFFLGYRRFITPMEFLDMLIARFKIPNPPFYREDLRDIHEENGSDSPRGERLRDVDEEKFGVDSKARHILRKFRSTYKKKVQLRVVNAIWQWLQNREYFKVDFQDSAMQEKVRSFLHDVRESGEKYLIKIVDAIEQWLDKPPKPLDVPQLTMEDSIDLDLPVLTSFLTTMHPLEFARQVTLYEWELYRHIEFWELSGKEKTPENASNMLRCIEFSNKFTYWLIYLVVNLHSAEERAIILERLVDLYNCFQVLNNMQGCQEIKGVLNSSAVWRLKHTMEMLLKRNKESHRQLEELINMDENTLTYEEYLSQMKMKKPPCVPFSASGDQSELIRLKIKQPDVIEAHPMPMCEDGVTVAIDFRDFDGDPLPEPEILINFGKINKHFKVVDYFKSFQNCPYAFRRNLRVWEFFDNLDVGALMGNPAEKRDLIECLHNRSVCVEPKNMAPLDGGQKALPPDPNDPQGSLSEVELRLADELHPISLHHRTDKKEALNFAIHIQKVFNSTSSSTKRGTLPFSPPQPQPAPLSPPSQSFQSSLSPSSTVTSSEHMSFGQENISSSPSNFPSPLSVPPTPNRPSVASVKHFHSSQGPPAPSIPRRKLQSECHNAPTFSQQGTLSAGSTGSTTPATYSMPHHQHSISAPSRSPEPTSKILESDAPPIPPARPPRDSSMSHSSLSSTVLLPPTLFETSTSQSVTPPLPARSPKPVPPSSHSLPPVLPPRSFRKYENHMK